MYSVGTPKIHHTHHPGDFDFALSDDPRAKSLSTGISHRRRSVKTWARGNKKKARKAPSEGKKKISSSRPAVQPRQPHPRLGSGEAAHSTQYPVLCVSFCYLAAVVPPPPQLLVSFSFPAGQGFAPDGSNLRSVVGPWLC